MNVWQDGEWEVFVDRGELYSRRRRLIGVEEYLGGAERMGASVWDIAPGATQVPYHFHDDQEELLIVLEGQPTLRSAEGERELDVGEVVFFASGPGGAHQLVNRTDEVVRALFVSELELVGDALEALVEAPEPEPELSGGC
ncbi:MAG: cupin domain-containing protein [Gaiellaceae bacterium]